MYEGGHVVCMVENDGRAEKALRAKYKKIMVATHSYLLSVSLFLSAPLPFSSQPSVYVVAVAEEDGGEKIMLCGTLGENSLKLKCD